MRMPFIEFISSCDLKFTIAYVLFFSMATFQFIKKIKNKKNKELTYRIDDKIQTSANWILLCSLFSLLLGFMHSFYFMGKLGGLAPEIKYQGFSYALVTPVLGIVLYMFCQLFKSVTITLKNK